MAELGAPDMKLPIQYALFYPDRMPLRVPRKRADFYTLKSLTFEEPDMETFTGLPLAIRAGKTGGSLPTVYNAANERAVALFLDKRIGFLEIVELIEKAMDHHTVVENPDVDQILAAEQETYEYLEGLY